MLSISLLPTPDGLRCASAVHWRIRDMSVTAQNRPLSNLQMARILSGQATYCGLNTGSAGRYTTGMSPSKTYHARSVSLTLANVNDSYIIRLEKMPSRAPHLHSPHVYFSLGIDGLFIHGSTQAYASGTLPQVGSMNESYRKNCPVKA